ncbi:MAG: DUF7305 domain-containing protein [Candidatus Binatia bacterium]
MNRLLRRCDGNQRGSAMILALGFLVVLMIMAAGVHGLVLGQLRASGRARQRVAAVELAEGGLARARAWFASANYQLPNPDLVSATVPVLLVSNKGAVALPSNHPDAYTDAAGAKRTAVVSSFGASLNNQTFKGIGSFSVVASLMAASPETWELVSTATVGNVQRSAGALLIRESQALFQEALFTQQYVSLTGNANTDSFDSTLGNYGGSNRFATGGVRSNGSITMTGSTQINGDAVPGPGAEVIMSGNPKVTGASTPATTGRSLETATVPGGAVSLGALMVANNDKRTITAGTYVLTSLSVGGSGALTIDTSGGPVTFYVTGATDIGGNGGVTVTNGGARNFMIIQVGGGNVWIGGSGRLTAGIYAPGSNLTIDGNADLWGGFVGGSANLDGSGKMHFDQSLKTAGSAGGKVRLLAQWTLPDVVAKPKG